MELDLMSIPFAHLRLVKCSCFKAFFLISCAVLRGGAARPSSAGTKVKKGKNFEDTMKVRAGAMHLGD